MLKLISNGSRGILSVLIACFFLTASAPAFAVTGNHPEDHNPANPVYTITSTDEVKLRFRADNTVLQGNSLMAEVNIPESGMTDCWVENAKGEKVWSASLVLDPGLNLVRFKVSELPDGYYILKVKSGEKESGEPFVVQ